MDSLANLLDAHTAMYDGVRAIVDREAKRRADEHAQLTATVPADPTHTIPADDGA